MSEPQLIQPLLAEHIMGDPISDHHGVRCCPAMRLDSDSKYIVKIISIPASAAQLDALLLSGAYSRKEDALNYFRDLADDTVHEAELLQRLSKLEGFVGYDGWQVVPMADGVGFAVYLLGPYRTTLDRHFHRQPMTHLGAVNLGLDLCAALSVCRRNGYLYVDLKPENVHITHNQEYRIGDLGFISLNSLKYASLPEKYRSAYTAPEITDAFSSLNETIDIYAAGLILYQAYNNGELPSGPAAPGEPLPPPAYADYEMAEIILRACAPDPADRWQDPMQMGQALVSYMQRNSVNDTPIIPVPVPEESEEMDEAPAAEEAAEAVTPEEQPLPEEEAPHEEASADTDLPEEDTTDAEPISDAVEEIPTAEESLEDTAPSADAPEAASEPELSPEAPEEPPSETEETEQQEEYENLSFFDDMLLDETVPSEESTAAISDTVLSEEMSEMMAQVDELIEHKIPDPVVAPEPIDVPIPPRIVSEPETPAAEEEPQEESVQEVQSVADTPEDTSAPVSVAAETATTDAVEEFDPPPAPVKKRRVGGIIALLSAVLLLLCAGLGGYFYYQNHYLQPIFEIGLNGEENQLTVTLDTKIDNSLLTVYCTDSYGNKQTQSVQNNTAVFSDLRPDTSYKITIEIAGFHKLIGKTSTSYTTAAQTSIVSFNAIAGDRDGSVILNFSVQGPDNTAWKIRYSAPGQPEKVANCTGHMAAITNLVVGYTYTFQLEPDAELYVVGTDTLEYTATKVIYPENLTILGFYSGALNVTWDAPADTDVESWTVRCYNSSGYDSTITVTDTSAVFENLDASAGYTVDVKAAGMSVSQWASVSADSVTFKEILLDNSTAGQLVINWTYEGTAPADGWKLLYTVDGSELQVVYCEKNTCTIFPLAPGSHYSISFELPDGVTSFGGSKEFDAPKAESFAGYRVTAANMHFKMCRRPDDADWTWSDVKKKDYTTEFTVGESASFVVRMDKEYDTSTDIIENLFVIRDANGIPVSITAYSGTWTSMWYKNYCEMDLPVLPQVSGNYTVEIYFNSMYVTTQEFTVIE